MKKPTLAFTRARRCLLLLTLGMAVSGAKADTTPELIRNHQGRVTYVDFWASWCAPCAQSFPWLNAMQAKYGDRGLRVVGVDVDTEARNGDRFLKAHPSQFDIVRDPEGHLAERYGVEGMPYALLLDADGNVIHRHSGFNPADVSEYERAIEQAIQTALAAKENKP